MDTNEFIKSLCGELNQEWPAEIQATLTLDGQPLSTGLFALESKKCGRGTFQPTDGNNLNKCPSNGATLKLSGRTETLRVTHFQRCPSPWADHFHFHFE